MSEAVLTEEDGAVLIITINRPEAKNAVNSALAGGCGVALSCAMIVAPRGAQFGLPGPKGGLGAGGGGLLRLPQRIPFHIAMEIPLPGDKSPAARMAELGFVNRLAEPGQAL